MLELDQEPAFDIASLLAGGDGLDRRARWLAVAPHLEGPAEVDAGVLPALQAVSGEDWTTPAELAAAHGDAVAAALLASGLLVVEGSDADARDRTVREVAWWTPALVAQAHGGWDDVDVEARHAAGQMLDSAGLVEAFGPAPDPAPRRRPDTAPLPLPWPAAAAGSPFDALLAARRTCRNFDPDGVLAAGDFAAMLRRVWGVVGTRELAPGAVAVKKTSPAGGGLHAIEAYALVQRVEGVAPGLYHYLAAAHALEPLRRLDADGAKALARRFVAGQPWFLDAPAMVLMVARFDRLFWKYRRHAKAWRVVHLDAGHLSQTMYLSAAELGLGAFVTAAINDRAIGRELGLPPLREAAIALVGFGPRSGRRETMELDDYVPVQGMAADAGAGDAAGGRSSSR